MGGGDHSAILGSNLNLTLPAKFEWNFKMKCNGCCFRINLCKNTNVSSNPQYSINIESTNDGRYWCNVRTTSNNGDFVNVYRDGNYHDFKIIRDGSTITFYVDGVLQLTKPANWIDDYTYTFYWSYWHTNTMQVKDLMIKSL